MSGSGLKMEFLREELKLQWLTTKGGDENR